MKSDRRWYYILLAAFLLYICVGIFPLYCYETDGMHLIKGMAAIFNQGLELPPIYEYEYNMQPLVYLLVPALRHILPFFTCEQLYCLLTGAAALAFVPVAVNFVHRLTHVRRTLILLALFLFPETMAIAMYPNTAILALLPATLGFTAILRHRYIPATLLLALAPLFRVDIVMIYPAAFFLFPLRGTSFRKAFDRTLVFASILILLVTGCYALLRANPFVITLERYHYYERIILRLQTLTAIFSFYNVVNIALLIIGIWVLAKRRNWKLLALSLTAALLVHLFYGRMGCAAKHFLYTLPFLAIITSEALDAIRRFTRSRRALRISLVAALVIVLFSSARVSKSATRPYRDIAASESRLGPVAQFFTVRVPPRSLTFGLGAGEVLETLDEKMLASGNALYPIYIHNLKERQLKRRNDAVRYIGDRDIFLLNNHWETNGNLPAYYMDRGFSLFYEGNAAILTNGRQTIRHIQGKILENEDNHDYVIGLLRKSIDDARAQACGKPVLIFCSTGILIYYCDLEAERGNLRHAPGTESLYIIEP